jgi:hypothetical protein
MVSRSALLAEPRSGARPLAGSEGASTPRQPARAPAQSASRTQKPAGEAAPSRRSATPAGPASSPSSASSSSDTPKSDKRGSRKSSRRSREQFRAVQSAHGSPRFSNYQGIILAEFVLAELLVAATPIATRKDQAGLSPYVPRDLTKLLSIGMVYFLLQLLAVGGPGPGRLGAWFGGLVLLSVGLNESANIAKDLQIFSGGSPKQATGTSQKTGTITAGGRG